jgi:hypothetical protein
MDTRMDMNMITCTTATVIVTMAMHLSQCLLWPALVLRWALLQQPGMPVHAICAGPLVTAMMLAHARCQGPLVAARHTVHTLCRALMMGIWGSVLCLCLCPRLQCLGLCSCGSLSHACKFEARQVAPSAGKRVALRLAVLP